MILFCLGGDQEVNAVNTNQSSSALEAQSIKPPVEAHSSVTDSAEESSDDVSFVCLCLSI